MRKPDNWNELNWQERREARFDWWRAAPGITFENDEAKANHEARLDRHIKAIKLEELPDRVPVNGVTGTFAAYYAGYDLKTCMFDAEKYREAWLKMARDFDVDMGSGPGSIPNGRLYELFQQRTHRWPGGGLPDDASIFQFVEEAYMREGEYDAYLGNPADYILRTFLPRTYGVFEPLAGLRPIEAFRGTGEQLMRAAGQPAFRKMAEDLLAAHEAAVAWNRVSAECSRRSREMGNPAASGAITLAPYDTLADMLRGTRGAVVDMFRRPDTVLDMVERILPVNLKNAVTMADRADSPMVVIPLHKGDDVFMSDAQFEKFYWPTFRRLLLGLIEEGLLPMPVAEGNYNRRLEFIKDLPKSGVMWLFEQSDMTAVKRVLGGHTCFGGNIGVSLMRHGTPEDVKEYSRWLIDTCAPGGGYILSMGAGIDKCDPANIHAMIDTAKEYGRY
jgi:uroporphyrinogen-III decarboxylase